MISLGDYQGNVFPPGYFSKTPIQLYEVLGENGCQICGLEAALRFLQEPVTGDNPSCCHGWAVFCLQWGSRVGDLMSAPHSLEMVSSVDVLLAPKFLS